MSILAQALIFEKYRERLNADALARFLGVTKTTLYNQLTASTCPVKTYVDGKHRYAEFRDVAAHLDACRARAV